MKVYNLSYSGRFPDYDLKSKVTFARRCQKCRRLFDVDQDADTVFEHPMIASIKAKDRENHIFISTLGPIVVSSRLHDSLCEFGLRLSAFPCQLRYKLKGQLQENNNFFALFPAVRHHMNPYAVALTRLIDCSECGGTRWSLVGHHIPYPFTGDKFDFHFFVSDIMSGTYVSEELLMYLAGQFLPSDLFKSLDPFGTWNNSVAQERK